MGDLQDTSGPAAPRPAVLVVGAASRDLAASDPRGWRLGGAVCYSALTLARLGLPTRALVGTDALAADAHELDDLRAAGVDVALARLRRGPVFVNDEGPEGRVQRCVEVSDRLDPAALPRSWLASRAIVLGPVADELGPEWSTTAATVGLAALGWQGLLRTLRAGEPVARRPPGPSALVRRASLVGLSRSDVDDGLPLADLVRQVEPSATLVITDGERGGLVGDPTGEVDRRRWRAYPAIRADRVVDPTGAGDVFLATLLAARLDSARLAGPQARSRGGDVKLAAAAASLVVEAPGLAGVPTLDAVLARAARAGAGRA